MVPISGISQDLARYRVSSPEGVKLMRGSLERYGQLSPVVAFRRDGSLELIDGFKRLEAARDLSDFQTLLVRTIEADEQTAKAAIYLLNIASGRLHDLEEAWIIHSLVREDGLTQQEVAELLGRHKSWVCRRLALIERLCPEAKEDLQLGFLKPTSARELNRLPHGNQAEVLETVRRETLNTADTRTLVDVFLSSATRKEQEFVLANPHEALSQANGGEKPAHDPRLSAAGNRLARRLHLLLELLPRLEGWLRSRGHAELSRSDFSNLEPSLNQLKLDARSMVEALEDFLGAPIFP